MECSCYLFLEISCNRPPVFIKLILEMGLLPILLLTTMTKTPARLLRHDPSGGTP